MAVGDFNGDGKADLAAANPNSNNVSVLKKVGGQLKLATTSAAPSGLATGTTTSLFKIVATHNGLATDSSGYLSDLHLGFTNSAGTKLTSTRASYLVSALSIWKDANASGSFQQASDTMLVRYTNLSLDCQGRIHIPLPANASTLMAGGSSANYFVCVEKSTATTSADTLKTTHVTSASSRAFDANSLNPLSLETTSDVSSSSTALPVTMSNWHLE